MRSHVRGNVTSLHLVYPLGGSPLRSKYGYCVEVSLKYCLEGSQLYQKISILVLGALASSGQIYMCIAGLIWSTPNQSTIKLFSIKTYCHGNSEIPILPFELLFSRRVITKGGT